MNITQSLIHATVSEALSDYYPTRQGVFVGQLDDLADAVSERLAVLRIGTHTDEVRSEIRDMMATGMLFHAERQCQNPENDDRQVSVPYFAVDRSIASSPWHDDSL